MTELPDETKEELMSVLRHAAAAERSVIEFTTEDGELHAMDITDHVKELESEQ
jgi:hypothetical protein